nr:MAG: hypothetical protein H2Bulk35664_000002 [Mitovirus sp.]
MFIGKDGPLRFTDVSRWGTPGPQAPLGRGLGVDTLNWVILGLKWCLHHPLSHDWGATPPWAPRMRF